MFTELKNTHILDELCSVKVWHGGISFDGGNEGKWEKPASWDLVCPDMQ